MARPNQSSSSPTAEDDPIYQQIIDLLDSGGPLGAVAKLIGEKRTVASSALGAAVPMLVAGFGRQARSRSGSTELFRRVSDDDGSALADLPAALKKGAGGGPVTADGLTGNELVGSLFSDNREAVEQELSDHTGVDFYSTAKLLPALAPIVLGFLGRQQSNTDLKKAGLAKLLTDDARAMERNGMGSMLSVLASGGATGQMPALDMSDGALGGAGASGAAAVGAKAASANKKAKGAAAATSSSSSSSSDTDDTDAPVGPPPFADWLQKPSLYGRPAFLGWLVPLLLAAGLGLLIWQCSGDGDSTTLSADDIVDPLDEDLIDETDTQPVPAEEPAPETATTAPAAPAPDPTAAPTEEPAPEASGRFAAGSILEAADEAGNFTTLLTGVEGIDAVGLLESDGPFTIFAPTDEAFEALDNDALASLADADGAQLLLGAHILEGIALDPLVDAEEGNLVGETLIVDTASGTVTSAPGVRATIGEAITADNGIIYVIDRVLLPSVLAPVTLNDALALEPITFETGSAVITAEGEAVLDQAVAFLASSSDGYEIAGHTDSDGDAGFNQSLSEDRAAAVVTYLVQNGLDESRFTATGYGANQPIADNATVEGRAANRRIEFVPA